MTQTSYRLLTRQARETSMIIESGLAQSSKLRFLVFGPAKGKSGYKSHRLAVRTLIIKMGQLAVFPEEMKQNLVINTAGGIKVRNPVLQEFELIKDYDYTIILMISLGAIVEFSVYFLKNFSHKIRLLVPSKFRRSKSS